MRKLSLLSLFLYLGQQLLAQGCSDLIISEYCEGSGNNKGVELYNTTADPIDLGPYVLQRWSNGEGFAGDELDLQGTVPGYGTWVVVNGQTEDIDIGGGTISPLVDPEMQALADQLDNPYPAPTYMNGNDAIILVKNSLEIVDIFGKPMEDPGVAWTDNADAGFTDADGGAWLTANHTLRRKWSITQGVVAIPSEFFALAEYDSLPNNTWDGLGIHECSCDPNSTEPVGIEELIDLSEVLIGPNPSSNGYFHINSNLVISRIQAFDQGGRLLIDEEVVGAMMHVDLDLSMQKTGIYTINVYHENGTAVSQRVIKK